MNFPARKGNYPCLAILLRYLSTIRPTELINLKYKRRRLAAALFMFRAFISSIKLPCSLRARSIFTFYKKWKNTASRSARYENTLTHTAGLFNSTSDSRYHFSGPIEFYEHTTGWWNFHFSFFIFFFFFRAIIALCLAVINLPTFMREINWNSCRRCRLTGTGHNTEEEFKYVYENVFQNSY